MHVMDAGDLEIERRLDSFARARLTPDPQAAARIRARVMREARLQFEAARIAAHVMPAVTRARRRSVTRRLVMPFLAAAVWLGIAVGSISAAQAGGPLYPARMWIERATLPSGLEARAAAELEHLDARLAEAMAAAAHDDAGAVAAALAAYRATADDVLVAASASGNADLEALVAAALDHHRVVLGAVADRLADQGNATAAGAVETAIQRAIEHNETVIERLEAAQGGGAGSTGGGAAPAAGAGGASGGGAAAPGGATSGGGAAGSGGGGSGAGSGNEPGSGGTDDPGSRPERTPRPTPVRPDEPAATPRGGPDR